MNFIFRSVKKTTEVLKEHEDALIKQLKGCEQYANENRYIHMSNNFIA